MWSKFIIPYTTCRFRPVMIIFLLCLSSKKLYYTIPNSDNVNQKQFALTSLSRDNVSSHAEDKGKPHKPQHGWILQEE